MNNWWGIDLQPLINEIKNFSLSQQLSQQQIITLLKEQNQLLKKYLEQKQ